MALPIGRRLRAQVAAFFAGHVPPLSLLLSLVLWKAPFTRRWFPSLFPLERKLLAIYVFWMILIDSDNIRKGGRTIRYFYNGSLWRTIREDYFPCKAIKTCELDPNETYIFGIHPHGILCFGAFFNLVSNRDQTLPGIDFRMIASSAALYVPFWRDLLLAMGAVSNEEESIHYLLSRGISVGVVPGGAQEALLTYSGTHDVYLKERLGFIRVAIVHGASLVPVYTFGENDIYKRVFPEKLEKLEDVVAANTIGSGTGLARKIQQFVADRLGVTFPLFHGKWGSLQPYEKPLVTVIGKPIRTTRTENPSKDMVAKVHRDYMRSLEELFNQYKDVYAPDRKRDLRFVGRELVSNRSKM